MTPVAPPMGVPIGESLARIEAVPQLEILDDAADAAPAPAAMLENSAAPTHDEEQPYDDGQDALPLDAEVPEEHDIVLRWAEALDEVDYIVLLNLPSPAALEDVPADRDVRLAFHEFALRFHPDRYRDAPDDVRLAAAQIFGLGTEAYRVLKDPTFRRRYVKMLVEGGTQKRLRPEEIAEALVGDTKVALRIQQMARTAAARPYAIRADELVGANDLKQARLQLQLCMMRDPGNVRLEERMKALEAEIAGKK